MDAYVGVVMWNDGTLHCLWNTEQWSILYLFTVIASTIPTYFLFSLEICFILYTFTMWSH